MTSISSDEPLAKRARTGDRAAFEELVRRCARELFARLYLETGDPHRAEDLAQEAFLSAWRSIASLDDPRTFRSWLWTIAHRALIDAHRKDHRAKRGPSMRMKHDDVLNDAPDPGPEPSARATHIDERDRVLGVLRSLPEEYRLPLMLRYLGDADYETISRQLALSNGSLRGLLQRGMEMLRERLKTK